MTLCGSQVSERVWGDEHEPSGEEGGGGVTWEAQAMEVKGQVISAPGERKQQIVCVCVKTALLQ